MLIAVKMDRGPSPVLVDVRGGDDEIACRKAAWELAYCGEVNPDDPDMVPDTATIAQMTEIVVPLFVVI